MTASSSTKFEILRFNGFNYPAWKLKMHAIFIKDECAIALTGKENKPEGMTDKVFDKKDELAMTIIYLALDKVILFNVFEETIAKGLCDKLQNPYEGKSMSNKIFLRKKLYNLKMTEDSSLQEHLSEFNNLMSCLAAIGEKIDEKEKATLLLCSMLES